MWRERLDIYFWALIKCTCVLGWFLCLIIFGVLVEKFKENPLLSVLLLALESGALFPTWLLYRRSKLEARASLGEMTWLEFLGWLYALALALSTTMIFHNYMLDDPESIFHRFFGFALFLPLFTPLFYRVYLRLR